MKYSLYLALTALISAHAAPPVAQAFTLSGHIAAQGTYFPGDALYSGQKGNGASIAVETELYREWNNGGFTLSPFYRVDSVDEERTHFDLREAIFLWYGDTWEFRAGAGKVFWGVTESQHLVDIVNQTDLVEALDEEEKLGQPMLNLTLIRDWGTLDFFVLPYFRERTFPGVKGRLRTPLTIDTDNAVYESSDKERHVDFAVRYAHTLGDMEIGISQFNGTGREPTFISGANGATLVPYYEQISQTGIDLLLVAGGWLLKTEAIYRSGQGDEDYFAHTSGFEYTFTDVGGIDIGAIGEMLYDDRGKNATTAFENDLMAGLRLAFNDAASTEMLFGYIHDILYNTRILTLESSRRLTDHWKISLESFFIMDASQDDTMYLLREDDYIQLELIYYF